MNATGMNRRLVGIAGTILVLGVACALTGCEGDNDGPGSLIVSMTAQDTFNPAEVLVAAGDTVTWTNNDADNHAATSDPRTAAGGPNSDTAYAAGILPGGTYRWAVPATATSETRWYHCRLHGNAGHGSSLGTGMVGIITVKQSPPRHLHKTFLQGTGGTGKDCTLLSLPAFLHGRLLA